MFSYIRYVLLLLAITVAAGCAHSDTPPQFLAPQDRPVALKEKPWPTGHVLGLAYHDVEDGPADNRFMSVRTANLIEQLAWLKQNGYQAVSVDQILAARQGGQALPDQAVLLSFDDGYSSFAERVLPILKAYRWPAVFAPVGVWLGADDHEQISFGNLRVPRERFANPTQLKEIAASGLVEFAAHSEDSHMGVVATPQGNLLPKAAYRMYDKKAQRYETREEYQQRIQHDVQSISQRLQEITGQAPRVWVWPYGQSSGTALQIIGNNGYEIALTLEDGLSTMGDLQHGPRHLLDGNPSTSSLARSLSSIQEKSEMRVAHVDLDYVYDPDPKQMDDNLGVLVQRIKDMRITTVFLQAYADPEGDGTVKSLYFPNRHLPMRADLFNRAAWQLLTRAGVKVYAWMPVLSFDLDPTLERVQTWHPDTGKTSVDPDQYQRLSPFDPQARQQIIEIYEDLASHAYFFGVLFHDDALLSDFEDASPSALAAYREAGLGNDLRAMRDDKALMQRWTRFKSRYLVDFTLELAKHVRAKRGPEVKTARNIYAQPILHPASETWFAQNLDDFLESYDWTAPMAMPLMEGVSLEDSNAWLARLVGEVAKRPDGLERSVFELQARDWGPQPNVPIDDAVLTKWMQTLQHHGVRHFGYYPDDFLNDQPRLKQLRPALSNAWSPLP